MKRQMDAFRSGNVPADARSPEQVRTLMDTVTRWVELVDRTSGASVAIAFCKTRGGRATCRCCARLHVSFG